MRWMALALACTGCVAHRVPAWRASLADPADPGRDFAALVDRAERAFLAREDPARLDEAIARWREAERLKPGDAALLVRLSRAARARANTLRGREATALAEQAVAYAERALATRGAFRERTKKRRVQPHQLFAAAERADEPALIAYASALFAWSEGRSFGTLLAQQDWIHAAASRAAELDRTAEHGAPDRLLAMLESSLPTADGAELTDALDRFEAALAEAPGYLPTRLEYAQRYAARLRDGRLYRRLLEEVLAADADALADARPENRAAQREARALLAE
jgi:TRAP transporter T-component